MRSPSDPRHVFNNNNTWMLLGCSGVMHPGALCLPLVGNTSIAAPLNSCRPQGWWSIPTRLLGPIWTHEIHIQCWACPVAPPQTQFCQCTAHGSDLHCSRDFFSLHSASLWFSGLFRLCGLPFKPSRVWRVCERCKITALHQTISPFTSMRKKNRGERKMSGGGAQQRPRERNREERKRRRRDASTEWCCLFEATERNLYLWQNENSRLLPSLSFIYWLLLNLSFSLAHLLPWCPVSQLCFYHTLFLSPSSSLCSQPPSGSLSVMSLTHMYLLDLLDGLQLEQ